MSNELENPPSEKPANKGKFQGICARTACPNTDAVYFNSSTRMYYCKHCANLINKANRADNGGLDLCVLQE